MGPFGWPRSPVKGSDLDQFVLSKWKKNIQIIWRDVNADISKYGVVAGWSKMLIPVPWPLVV